MGTPTPVINNNGKIRSCPLDASVSLDKRLGGDSHDLYLSEPGVFEQLVRQAMVPRVA
ncbi:MAG TPA: hypothetical protein VKZ49_08760 [Polyangiaceae bacterium]|nr:hypothetical protein [Polyangiaceae bacterium]